jgi:hypothetical protein
MPRLTGRIKRGLAKTPLHGPLLKLQSARQYREIMATEPNPNLRTGFCISPYKTGTTFVANIFDPAHARHEPIPYPTMRWGHDPDFMHRRKAWLNLKCESFGYHALHAERLSRMFPDDNMVFMIRDPSDWMRSIFDYFSTGQSWVFFNYGGIYYWSKILRVNTHHFYDLDDEKRQMLVEDLMRFWVKVYRTAETLPNGHIIRLSEADDNIELLEHLFHQKAVNLKTGFRRVSSVRRDFSAWDWVNRADYEKDVAHFGY